MSFWVYEGATAGCVAGGAVSSPPPLLILNRMYREFFLSRKIDLGGTTLEQYLAQLRIAVTFRERERRSLRELLHS